jgi:hypothetical protein
MSVEALCKDSCCVDIGILTWLPRQSRLFYSGQAGSDRCVVLVTKDSTQVESVDENPQEMTPFDSTIRSYGARGFSVSKAMFFLLVWF